MDEDELRGLIQQKLDDGGLPHDSIPRVWGGPGDGERCHACEHPIARGHLVMEGINREGRPLQLHVRCFYVWDAVRHVPGR